MDKSAGKSGWEKPTNAHHLMVNLERIMFVRPQVARGKVLIILGAKKPNLGFPKTQ